MNTKQPNFEKKEFQAQSNLYFNSFALFVHSIHHTSHHHEHLAQ